MAPRLPPPSDAGDRTVELLNGTFTVERTLLIQPGTGFFGSGGTLRSLCTHIGRGPSQAGSAPRPPLPVGFDSRKMLESGPPTSESHRGTQVAR